jgi:hypothetical protein
MKARGDAAKHKYIFFKLVTSFFFKVTNWKNSFFLQFLAFKINIVFSKAKASKFYFYLSQFNRIFKRK